MSESYDYIIAGGGSAACVAATRLVRADNLVTLYRVLGGDMLTDALPAKPPLPTVSR